MKLLLNQKNEVENNRKAVAESRVSFGNSSALALRIALMKSGQSNSVLWGLYHRISACALRQNHWIGEDLHNEETGELYKANGNLWGCGSRLCPACVSKLSRRARKELRVALEDQKLFCGENYQFITLTMPNPNRTILRTRGILDRAWSLFRKRDYFKNRIRGGSKSEEFTVTDNGYHYHFHLLAVTRFLAYEVFRREWTDCLKIAFAEQGLPCEFKTADGLAMVKVERVSGKKNIEGAVLEVCKYITKSDSWEKITEKDLIEIASIKRFPRMFELFGCFRDNREAKKNSQNSDFDNEIELKESEFVSNYTILDTKCINDGEADNFSSASGNSPPALPEKLLKVTRQESWRIYIEKFGLEKYLDRLSDEIHRAQEWRKCALRMKYPYAEFSTLSNEVF